MTKKLLQINVAVNVASTGRLVEDLGQVAIENGWESYAAFGRKGAESLSHKIKIGGKIDILFHVIKTRLFDKHGFGSKRATKQFIEKIKEIQPDIIQFHNIHGYYLNIKVLFKYLATANIPVVWSLHDCWTMTGHCSHFALIGCEKWKTECFSCPLKHAYPSSWIDKSRRNYRLKKSLFTELDNVTMVSASKWLGNIIKESYLSKYSVEIIPNGIDTKVFAPKSNSNEIRKKYNLGGKFVIMGVGTKWGPEKGLDDYYKLRKVLNEDYVIVLVGMSERQIKNAPTGIIGVSRTNSVEELAQFYSSADVITSLSYLEAFGLTPVEGFACGTPAIVYNCTSSPELITPEIGLVVEPGNINDIVSAIETVRRKGKAHYSENCRKQAEALYKREDRFGDYIRLYEEILRSKKI